MGADCLFCRIVRGELPSVKVYEDDEIVAFRDVNPAAPVHALLVPKVHVSRLSECGEEHRDMLGKLMLTAGKVAEREKIASFRLIVNDGKESGQTVFHLHAHVVGGRNLSERLL